MAQKLDLQPIQQEELDLQPLDLQPVTPAPKPVTPPAPKKQEEGFLSKIYRHAFEAPEVLRKSAKAFGDVTTQHTLDETMLGSMARGFQAGALEGFTSLLSPVNILTMGRGRLATLAARAAGGAQATHGASELAQGNLLQGAADVGFGALGLSARMPKSDTAKRLLDLHGKDLANPPTLPNTPKDIIGGAPIRPQFNPKGQTGMTGNLQSVAEGAKKPRIRIDAEGNKIDLSSGEQLSPARTESGGIKIGADTESLGKILGQSLYSKNIAISATKEMIQNSLDAVKHLGPKGKIDVTVDRINHSIKVADNGSGMTRAQVETVLTDLGSSGKSADEDIGGFGIAKASFLLGGKHVSVSTVARDPITGELKATEFDGTPDDLLRGIDIDEVVVPEGTPTGTSITVKVPENSAFYESNDYIDKLQKYSNYPGQITFDRFGNNAIRNVPERMFGGEVLAEIPSPSGNSKLIIPKDATKQERGALDLILTNRGMYQGTQRHYLERNVPDMPDKIIVDISSNVPVKHEDYPFTANREALRGSVMEQVKKYIDDNLVNPAVGKYRNELIQVYNTLPIRSGIVSYDPSGKFTSGELDTLMTDPIMQNLYNDMYDMVNTALINLADTFKPDQLEKLGFIFSETLRGIHIPNPGGGKSAILINPLQIMMNRTPDQAAAGWVHTILHELTHMNVGEHNESFTIALGDVHEKFGGTNAAQAVNKFKSIVGDTPGTYNKSTQKLLQKYTESRGRKGTENNLLTRTGIGSEDTGGGSEGAIHKFIGSLGKGAARIRLKKTTPEIVKELMRRGYEPGGVGPDGLPYMTKNGQPQLFQELPLSEPEKASFTQEMFNLSRGLSTSWDLSAPFRQGLPLIGTKNFWKSIPEMVKALGDKGAYDLLIADIKSHPYFKEDFDVDFVNGRWVRKRIPSLAEKAGLAITDLKTLTNREEALMSTWAEKVPGVKASNRAYSVFLNKLRADTFRSLMDDAIAMDLDPKNNFVLMKEIADYVNTATGRGPLRTHLPTLSGTLKERSVEQAAGILTNSLFSPRLVASRVRMLNPATYIAANPFVRKQYMKSLLHTAAAWGTVASLGKMAGADVILDPNNADFGKVKIGNTRLDPAGGFQQYLVLASRMISGKTTPSTSPNKTREFGKGYQAPTRFKVMQQFAANKLHPVLKFAYDLFDASEYKSVQMGDRILQMYVPLVVQDVMELAKEDPKLLPLVIPTAVGMGTQTYEKGERENLFIPPELDYTYEGGSFF